MEEKRLSERGGKFDKCCGLSIHVPESDNCSLLDIDQRRLVTTFEKEFIVTQNLLNNSVQRRQNRKIYSCDDCLQKVKHLMLNPTKKIKQEEEVFSAYCDASATETETTTVSDETVAAVVSALEKGQLMEHQVNRILQVVGMRIHAAFAANKHKVQRDRLERMRTKSYVDEWKSEQNAEWKQLLTCVCNLSDTVDDATARRLTKCTDLVRLQLDRQYISDLALSEALVILQFSHSKYAVDLFCKTNAAGSFSTVRRTMALLGSKDFQLPPNDVALAFDNNQVIQKTWMFKHGGKQVVSTVTTMVCYDRIQTTTKNQFASTIPTALFPTDSNKKCLLTRFKDFQNEAANINRGYRKAFIESRITKVHAECSLVDGKVHDVISKNESCETQEDDVFSYKRVPAHQRSCRVIDAECMEQNPNSFKAVALVLDKILQHLKDCPEQRNYVPVYMDGSPYSICMKLVREKYVCDQCKVEVDSGKKLDHISSSHGQTQTQSWSRKYKQIVIRPGSGHIEMTCVRTIISTFWLPIIKPVAAILGYNSESQLEYCKKAFDHHKSYNLLMVIFSALSDELVYPYVVDAIHKKIVPTFEGYCEWALLIEKDNLLYKLASHFCFTTLHSLQLFRSGIRTCNDELALYARHKLTALLYGCNNIKYQEMMCYDTLYLLSLDPSVRRNIMDESCRRENGEVGEGYDFLLENRNKLYKSFLPSDSAPSFSQWQQVSRTAMDLEQIREIAGNRLELNLRPSTQRPRKFQNEIYATRTLLRNNGFLAKKKHDLTCITDASIRFDSSLINFVQQSENNRKEYYEHYLDNEKIHLPLLNGEAEVKPLETNEDELRNAIQRKLKMLREPFYSFYKKSYKKSLTKIELNSYYMAITAQLQHQEDREYENSLSEAFEEYMELHLS